jgi:hypothetical protein
MTDAERSFALVHADQSCAACSGLGVVWCWGPWGHARALATCECVYRAVFDRTLARCEQFGWALASGLIVPVRAHTRRGAPVWGIRAAEFIADVFAVAHRAVFAPVALASARDRQAAQQTAEVHWRVFLAHSIGGEPWGRCAGKLGLSKGNFFHSVDRVKHLVGQAAVRTRPWPLYPYRAYAAAAPSPELSAERRRSGRPMFTPKPKVMPKVMAMAG